ncbi:MAG: TrmB family transcriptional regulator [Gemmatimonadetes bacterium]|nr:TrmB family transcriptional regulator [Gemmatimonadota bacterium]
MAAPSIVQPLVSLGFTALEAEVYTYLLREAPVTGYRIAQALRKPAPNIYKAIESLELKGAVLVEEGASRRCRPVPPDELLGHLERRFRDDTRRAAQLLADVSQSPPDDRVYTLRSPDQVLERARRMLADAREVVLADVFPLPLAELRKDLEATARRGALVTVKVYEPTDVAGARVVTDGRADIFERWPGQWVNLVVDGREHLVAFLSPDGKSVHQAVWSGSLYLSWVYHSAVGAEMSLDAVRQALADGADARGIARLIDEMDAVKALQARGYRELTRRVADGKGGR